jgi:hypothetical protein
MADFAGLDPPPCSVCGGRDNLKFLSWTRSKVQPHSADPRHVLRTYRVPAEVTFICSVDNSDTTIIVPDTWRPPPEWAPPRIRPSANAFKGK